MSKKISYSMMITESEKEIMDFVTDVVEGGVYSKAQLILNHFNGLAEGYCGFPDGYTLSSEMLLSALKEAKKNKDSVMVGVVGIENYKIVIQEAIDNGTFSDKDVEYHNSLIDLHIKNTGGNSNE